MLYALAFVLPDDVIYAYECIIKSQFNVDSAEQLNVLLTYFERT